jgi:ribosomal protein L29
LPYFLEYGKVRLTPRPDGTMTAVAFDTLKLARTLRTDAKMPAEQAEGIANALAEAMSGAELATKADLGALRAELKADLAEVRNELKADIAEVRNELKADIAGVRSELKADIAELRTESKTGIAEAKSEILKTVMGMILGALVVNILATLGAMVGLAKMLGH